MRDWLDAIPNLGVPGVPGVEPQKTAPFSGTPRNLAGVPGVPEPASAVLRRWHARLSLLRLNTPPDGLDARRWSRLVEDAHWLYTRHGSQLAREGWGDLDVFGVSTLRLGGEGLLDRLDGSRRLHLDGKGRAAWGWDNVSVVFQTCRGNAELRPAGALLPVWGLVVARGTSE